MLSIVKPRYLDHARVDMAHCLTGGLFLPTVQRVGGEMPPLNLRYQYGTSKQVLWWRNKEALDVKDMCVFLAVHRIAVEHARSLVLGTDVRTESGVAMRERLDLCGAATTQDCMMIETCVTELARIVGIEDSGQNLNNIAKSLDRLSSVTLAVYEPNDLINHVWKASLIKSIPIASGRLSVGLNPRLTSALLNRPTTYIDMRELRNVKNKVSKRLYVWLSSWANASQNRSVKMDVLMPHIWGRDGRSDSITVRNRRRALRTSIDEIGKLPGWICSLDAITELVCVQKPTFRK